MNTQLPVKVTEAPEATLAEGAPSLPSGNTPLQDNDVMAFLTARRQPAASASPVPAAATDPETPQEPAPDGDPNLSAETPLPPDDGDLAADPNAEATDPAADPASKSASDPNKTVQDRINGLVGMNSRLKAEMQELKGLLKEAVQNKVKAPPASGNSVQPFGHLQTPEDVTAARTQLLKFRGWALRHPEGGLYQATPEDPGRELDGDAVERALTTAEMALDSQGHLNQRLQAIHATAQVSAAVRQANPWLDDPEDPRTGAVEQVLAQYPQLRAIPQHLDWAARLAQSYAADAAKAKARPAAPPRRPAPEVPPRTAAPVAVRGQDEVKRAYAQFTQTGSDADFDAWQAAKVRAAKAQIRK